MAWIAFLDEELWRKWPTGRAETVISERLIVKGAAENWFRAFYTTFIFILIKI